MSSASSCDQPAATGAAASADRPRSNEAAVSAAIQLALGRGPVRLLRNNVGALQAPGGRLVRYGLGQSGATRVTGTSDLIGWRSVTITPDMVGQRLAVFCAVEVKDRGRPTPQQLAFISAVQAAGGLAGIARSVADAAHILRCNEPQH